MRAIGLFAEVGLNEPSPQNAERAFVDYCRVNMHQPVTTFSSDSSEGGEDNSAYGRLVRHLRESAGEFLIVVPDARHLGSDLEAVARAVVELHEMGANVTCFDEDFPDPLQNAFQTLGVKGVSRTRSRRIKESMRARALEGRVLGRPPFGYRVGSEGELEVAREEASVVELVYKLYTKDDLGIRLIVQHLNERDITTRRGGRWNVASIRDILRNISYTGTYTRLGVRRPRSHEAIIPSKIFRAAQDLAKERRPFGRVVNAEPFLLSGAAFCGYCGNKMMGVTRRQSWTRKGGRKVRGVYRYYQCQSRNNQSLCGYHTWREADLENAVLNQLKYEHLARQSRVRSDPTGVDAAQVEAKGIREAAVRNAERRFLQAVKRAARGDLSVASLGRYLSELDVARNGVSNAPRPMNIEETLAGWETLDMERRRAFLAEHVARITVEDDKVEVLV